mmetsp:Transcript_31622/g.51558  ORF Transcript_31622/g.51558 Transcript_31622/m.51558 type:complete len:555 (-) Transcript_31622:221-1885(-)|eukprot:CAMPEP_0201866574 /NCGR_PEP_ID=MMETSP0902-20130614/1110_1 /ASSEMBLY_ACC=CAM_ASM_000551 /TAXON_ID=420261 /ORGANISM="Thalassiosira antarctica, Strain CCMP982" /LENGTH=554 /DNA_ID=CAMNT_0048391567 /DNA_START=172 /DNA_END=1836 /DNA_ORIENTATION=-
MSVALWRARSSALVRSTASTPAGIFCLQRGSDKFVSSRATSLLQHPPSNGRRGNASYCFQKQIRANRISTTASRQKSAMPLSSIDDHGDNDAPGPSNSSYSTPFLLADIGEGISEVELLQWFVSPGDNVAQFDRVCEVQSDKAAVEITSRFDGIVESLCGGVGDMMFVGKPLLYIATENDVVGGGAVEQPEQPQKVVQQTITLNNVDDEQDRLRIPSVGANYSSYYEEKSDVENIVSETWSPRANSANTKVLTSPAVRKLGKENNIDLGTVLGTGPGGRVLKADILKIINTNSDTISPSSSPTLTQEKRTSPLVSSPEEDTVIPIRGYNRLMVKSMTSSLQIPHMVYADEINVNALTEVRDTLRPLAQEMGVPKLTYMPFFIKAASLALVKYPVLNSSIDVEEMTLTYHKGHDVGVAVDTERGLAVPVVKGCEDMSVLEIAMELGRLYSLAAEGNLSEADISSPTFTLSNIGAIGGTYMSPVVLPPQVAIGAMGKIQRLPRFVDDHSDKVEAARIMPISWGGDHRAVDGAQMARFSNLWKSYCENPASMMFAMR